MLDYLDKYLSDTVDDAAHTGRHALIHVLGKAGIKGSPELLNAMGVSIVNFGKDDLSLYATGPAAALFSGLMVQGQYMHERGQVLDRYRPEVAAWLDNGKKPEDLTDDDLHLAAYGDAARGIPGNITLEHALNHLSQNRTWGIGLSTVATGASAVALAHLRKDPNHKALTEAVDSYTDGTFLDHFSFDVGSHTIDLPEMMVMGAIAYGVYVAVKNPLTWLAQSLFGLTTETTEDKIQELNLKCAIDEKVTQQEVFEVFVAARPELAEAVETRYGEAYTDMGYEDQRKALVAFGQEYGIAALTAAINERTLRPQELAFLTNEQLSGVQPGEVAQSTSSAGSLRKIWNTCCKGFEKVLGKKETEALLHEAEEISMVMPAMAAPVETQPAPQTKPAEVAAPVHQAIYAESADGNNKTFAEVYHQETPERNVSFQQKLAHHRGKDGSVNFQEYIETTRSINSGIIRS